MYCFMKSVMFPRDDAKYFWHFNFVTSLVTIFYCSVFDGRLLATFNGF